jgi:small subunit ribosomal protein S2
MARVPSALWVVDTKKEHIAVSEARKLGIPVIAILDTNCDPDEVNYPIPGNDDAIRSVALLTRVVADAVADGLIARAGAAAAGEEKPAAPADGVLGAAEPLAEWERALLEGRPADEDGAGTTNGVANGTPAVAAAATDTASAATDTAPAATDTAPAATDTAPAATDTAPAATDTASAESAPAAAPAAEDVAAADSAAADQDASAESGEPAPESA